MKIDDDGLKMEADEKMVLAGIYARTEGKQGCVLYAKEGICMQLLNAHMLMKIKVNLASFINAQKICKYVTTITCVLPLKYYPVLT